jgi:hypothetical protein
MTSIEQVKPTARHIPSENFPAVMFLLELDDQGKIIDRAIDHLAEAAAYVPLVRRRSH